MNTGSAEAKVAGVAVAFTSFFGTLYGGVGALCKKSTTFAKSWAVR
ncbi:hypothetical protein [Sulfurospirillum arsenophilum]|nr:hypothetical protein [Sulfurospirillum arsenophilum]